MWPVALLVFFASITVPVLKVAGLVYLLVSVGRRSTRRQRDRTLMYRVIEQVGRWSMVDVFMISILTALVSLGELATIVPGKGAAAFAAVVDPDHARLRQLRPAADLGRREDRDDDRARLSPGAPAPPVPPRRGPQEPAVKRGRRRFSVVWLVPLVAAAHRGLARRHHPARAGADGQHRLQDRRGARGRQDQGALQGHRRRHRPGRAAERRPQGGRRRGRAQEAGRAVHDRGHPLVGGPAARRRLGRVRPRHPDLGRLHRPRPGPGQARPELHRPGGAAADDLGRAGPPLQPARRQPGLGRAGLAGLLPRPPGRPGARPHPRRRTGAASPSRSSSTRRTTGWCATRAGSGTRAASTSRSGRTASRSRPNCCRASSPAGSRSTRPASRRPARRRRRTARSTFREPAQGRRAGHHREGAVPGRVRRLGRRPPRRQPGAVQRHPGRRRHRRPARVRRGDQEDRDPGHARPRAAAHRGQGRGAAARALRSACATWWPRACGRSSSPATC